MKKRVTRKNPALLSFPPLPRLPRNTFAKTPHLPVPFQPPGEQNSDLFAREFSDIRRLFPKITTPEGRVYLWLQRYFNDKGGQHNWAYTQSVAGSYRQGGIEIDFLIFGPRLAWQVQGEHFHFGDPTVEGQDLVEVLVVQQEGYTVVNLLESMINQDVDRVCTEAMMGNQLYDDSMVSAGFTSFVGNFGANRAPAI